jgi:hypothetical protein
MRVEHLLVIAIGCGRADPQPSSSLSTGAPVAGTGDISRKPCEYMARADAETAVGQPLPNTAENIPLHMCDYDSAEFYGASLTLGEWEDIARAANSKPEHPALAMTGVGDEALQLGTNVYVRKGSRGFLLFINGPQVDHLPDHGLERTKVLARTIYARL